MRIRARAWLTTLVLIPAAVQAQVEAPPGFRVSVFHDGIGAGARHLVVRGNGDVLVARRDGYLVALRAGGADGRADETAERALPVTTGLALRGDTLYFSDNVSVSRLELDRGLLPEGMPQTVVHGFPEQGTHADKALALDLQGDLFVNVGAPSNACQAATRTPGSPGLQPCPQLARQAAIWRYPADVFDAAQQDGERFVTGTRNVVALDWSARWGALYFVMHGRDQLDTLWPELFDARDNAYMPAEELHRAVRGANYGWPYTFVDATSGRRLVAPEYEGDGVREAPADAYRAPLLALPAHWAPNDLVFYEDDAFPERYRGGAFVAWHGSWNRAPLPQEGYRVSFVPFANGVPSGAAEDFLLGFMAESAGGSGGATYRPSGLAVGADGALYVAESVRGRIWRVTFEG